MTPSVLHYGAAFPSKHFTAFFPSLSLSLSLSHTHSLSFRCNFETTSSLLQDDSDGDNGDNDEDDDSNDDNGDDDDKNWNDVLDTFLITQRKNNRAWSIV